MPRLIFINRFYWPEEPATSQLLTDLAEGLVAEGHHVSIIASRPKEKAIARREIHRGVHILRIGSSRFGTNSLLGRAIDFLSFTLGTVGQLLTTAQRGDTVIFLTDPPLLGALLWPILKIRNVRFLHWIQDIYPEIACELTPHRWLKLFTPLRNLSWRRAHCCVTLGQDMAQVVSQSGVSDEGIVIIPNWPPLNLDSATTLSQVEQLKKQWGLSGKFVALYSGNLGRVHDLSPLIALAGQLRNETDITFVFIGQGAQLYDLQSEVAARNLQNVCFFPPQPREKLNLTLALGDVHFVTLREGCENYVYPSKLYGITAVARPVLFIGPPKCELFQQIESEQIGLSFAPQETLAMAEALRVLKNSPDRQKEYQTNTSRFTASHNFEHSLVAWHKLLQPHSSLDAK